MKSDTTTVSLNNHLIKYADDVNLIVPEISDVHIGTEFIHIKQWAIKIKWLLIYKKNCGDGFPAIQPTEHSIPCFFRWYWSGSSCKFLGVFLQSNFSCEEHVKYILTVCSERMYLLRCLKAKGLPISKLHNICHAVNFTDLFKSFMTVT